MIRLGDVEHGMDDMIGLFQQTESDLQTLEDVCCDPNVIETQLKKAQVQFNVYFGNYLFRGL
jgi:hypothetical protein